MTIGSELALLLWGLGMAATLFLFIKHKRGDDEESSGASTNNTTKIKAPKSTSSDRYRGTKITYHQNAFDFVDKRGRNHLHFFLDAIHEVLGAKAAPKVLEIHPFGVRGAVQDGKTFHFYPSSTAANGGLNLTNNQILGALIVQVAEGAARNAARREIKKCYAASRNK